MYSNLLLLAAVAASSEVCDEADGVCLLQLRGASRLGVASDVPMVKQLVKAGEKCVAGKIRIKDGETGGADACANAVGASDQCGPIFSFKRSGKKANKCECLPPNQVCVTRSDSDWERYELVVPTDDADEADSTETGGTETGSAETGSAETGSAETGGAETGSAETGGAEADPADLAEEADADALGSGEHGTTGTIKYTVKDAAGNWELRTVDHGPCPFECSAAFCRFPTEYYYYSHSSGLKETTDGYGYCDTVCFAGDRTMKNSRGRVAGWIGCHSEFAVQANMNSGRLRGENLRETGNGNVYVDCSGCTPDNVPHEGVSIFPKDSTETRHLEATYNDGIMNGDEVGVDCKPGFYCLSCADFTCPVNGAVPGADQYNPYRPASGKKRVSMRTSRRGHQYAGTGGPWDGPSYTKKADAPELCCSTAASRTWAQAAIDRCCELAQ